MDTSPANPARSPSPSGNSHISDLDKSSIELRLQRLEGQVRGVQKMLEDDRDCEAVLIQVAAISSAARSVGLCILEAHVRGCLVGSQGRDAVAIADELTRAVGRFCTSLT